MNSAQLLRAEQVADVGRDRGEAAAIAGHDDEHRDHEQRLDRQIRQKEEQDDLDREEGGVGIGTADIVRQGCPADAAYPLNKPFKPTMVAAMPTDIPAISCAIGDATEMIAIPQVTLIKSISHSQ